MKVGLVLEGGASRAYFSVGVMDALLKNNIKPDYVIGTSAGIANGTSFVSGQFGRNWDIAEKYMSDKRYMGIKHLLNKENKSYYNKKFVFTDIPEKYLPLDYETFYKFAGEVLAAVTNIETGEAEYFSLCKENRELWADILIASCSLPFLFEPVEINGKKYMDGGIVDSIPFNKALTDGCDKIIAVITREKRYKKKNDISVKAAAKYFKNYPLFAEKLLQRAESYNNAREKLFKLEKQNRAFVIMPENTSGWKRTEADTKKLREMYDCGFNITESKINNLLAFIND